MGIIQKQSIISTVYTYAGVILGFVNTLLFANHLTTDENGLLKILVAYALLFAQFSSLGINNVTIKFFPDFRKDSNKHHGFFSLLCIAGLIGFTIFLLLFLTFKNYLIQSSAEKSVLFSSYWFYIIPLTFFILFFNSLDAYYRVLYQSTKGTFLKEFLQRVLISMSIVLLILNWVDFHYFVLLYCTALILPTFVIILSLIRDRQITLIPNFGPIKRSLWGQMLSVGSFGLITGFSVVAITQIDNLMINAVYGTGFTGIYAITSYFGVLVAIPSRSFLKIGATIIADSFNENDLQKISDIYKRSCLNQYIVGCFLLIGLWINIDSIFAILPAQYELGKYVILFIGLTNLVVMASGSSTVIISNSKYFKYNAYFTFILVFLTILTNYLFIPIYGVSGAAFATLISISLFNLLKFLLIYRKFKFQPYNHRYLSISLIAILSFFIVSYIPSFNRIWIDIPLNSAMVTILFATPIYYFNFSQDINTLLKTLMQGCKSS